MRRAASQSNGEKAGAFVAAIGRTPLPEASLDLAKMCLVDWLAVCLGARSSPEAAILARYVAGQPRGGRAPLLLGGSAAASLAALVNGTLSHCLDYDDTHIPTALHGSGPTWAAVLALGAEREAAEADLLKAFVGGFELGAALGGGGIGVRLNETGWHSTAVLGRVAAAAAAASLLGLDAPAAQHALGLAATQAGGLTASFGTMAKPFHAGKAAMDGLLAAELAAAGLQAATQLLDSPKGLFGTLFQDRGALPDLTPLGEVAELARNSFKPYAACQLTHAPIDAARALREHLGNRAVESLTVTVHPLAIEIAGVPAPRTPTAGRFSIAYCVALALEGHAVTPHDFVAERLADPRLVALGERVALVASPEVSRTAARLEARLADGATLRSEVEHAFGSVGNPMGWPQLRQKFASLVEPLLGDGTPALLETLCGFERPGSLRRLHGLLQGLPPMAAAP